MACPLVANSIPYRKRLYSKTLSSLNAKWSHLQLNLLNLVHCFLCYDDSYYFQFLNSMYSNTAAFSDLLQLPPVPAQAYERPLSRKISGKSDFGDYLEMSSVMKRDRCNSDPALSRKCSRDEAESETLGCRTVPLVLEEGRRGLKKKVSLLGDGDITSERRSVDNIYDFIAP